MDLTRNIVDFSCNISASGNLSSLLPKKMNPLYIRKNSIAKTSHICKPFCSSTNSHSIATPLIKDNKAFLGHLHQPMVILHEHDDDTKRKELVERSRRELQRMSKPSKALKLIDMLDRLGIAYHFEDDINHILTRFSRGELKDDLLTTSLSFRLLRHHGHNITTEIFEKFLDQNGKFQESMGEDIISLLSLYEASCMGTDEEEILLQAMEFSEAHLKSLNNNLTPQLSEKVSQALKLPRHKRMERLEARRFIEEYSSEIDCNQSLLELAKLDYNKVQSLHQMELFEIKRWWKQLGLVDKLPFVRDRFLECYLWTVGVISEPKYSDCRIELAKSIAILLVIDDVYDTHGTIDELILFTNAIRRWDLDVVEELPEYMKMCYIALYNTTKEISNKILNENGWSALPYLKETWINMVDGYMLEAKWFKNGVVPKLEEYLENGVTTSGSYMALVHAFFLIGKGLSEESVKLIKKPYPKLFSNCGRILRLWDDLGTSKEEQERGDLASSIPLLMKENNITSDEEARKSILQLIQNLWRELNGELVCINGFPLEIKKVAVNMARASQVVYQHEGDNYYSSVDNYVKALIFTPLN